MQDRWKKDLINLNNERRDNKRKEIIQLERNTEGDV